MKNTLLLLILIVPILVSGQIKSDSIIQRRNTLYIEALGQTGWYSLGFDRLFRLNKKVENSFSVGFAAVPYRTGPQTARILSLPLSYNFIFGHKNHHLELGAGLTLQKEIFPYPPNNDVFYYSYFLPRIGYRLQLPNGFFFRGTFMTFINLINHGYTGKNEQYYYFSNMNYIAYQVFPWIGINIGYTFK